jgi:hypothetical protein
MDAFNLFGAAITAGFGLLGLLAPKRAADLVGLKAVSKPGHSEFRATYGGLFLALGLAPLLMREPAAFAIAGLAWLGAAAGRIASIQLDRAFSMKNVAAVGLEAVVGLLLLVGRPLDAFVSQFGV